MQRNKEIDLKIKKENVFRLLREDSVAYAWETWEKTTQDLAPFSTHQLCTNQNVGSLAAAHRSPSCSSRDHCVTLHHRIFTKPRISQFKDNFIFDHRFPP